MQNAKKIISVIIPLFNEEKNIPLIYKEILKTWENLSNNFELEIIYINDGSKDKSNEEIEKLANNDPRVKHIEFSRNFGKEAAVSAGVFHSKGDAAIIIDADLQHPPHLMPQFIEKWKKGADVVIGIRKTRQSDSIIKKLGSYLFYKTMNIMGGTKITPNATDYRLLDKKVVNEFNRFTERNRISRGLIDWLGFERDFIYFDAKERRNGKPSYSTIKLMHLAISAMIQHSLFPLKFAGYLGVFITFFAGILGIFVFIEKFILNDPWSFNFSGLAILTIIIMFLIGIVLICLGLIALYIASIHTEVINRPLYIIKENKKVKSGQNSDLSHKQ